MIVLRLTMALLVVTVGVTAARAQSRDTARAASPRPPVVERVVGAFSEGSAERLLTPATDRVEVSLFGTRTVYSRSQASYVLRDFFDRYAPRRFVVDDVTETGPSYFVAGRYEHAQSDQPLQVYVRLIKQSGGTWGLHEVQVDPNAE